MDNLSVLLAVFDAAPDCITIISASGVLLEINAAGRSIFEASDISLKGASVYDVIVPEFRGIWKAMHERVCNGEKLTWEFDVVGFRGTRRHMEAHAAPLPMPDGSVAHLAIARDVTQRDANERRILNSEPRYRQMLQALPLPIYTTDLEGHITFYNEAAADFAGCRPTLGEQWGVIWRVYRLDGTALPPDQCPIATAVREGRPVRRMDAIAERSDGTKVRFTLYPTPLRDSSGQPIGCLNLLMDLTEKYEAQAVSERLASIVESSDDAIVSKTLDGIVTSWNAGAMRIFGYEAAEMIGQPIMRIIPPELRDEERRIIANLKQGLRVAHYETVRITKDFRRVDISLTVSPLYDKLGNVIGASKVARDITERKRAEKLQRLLLDELNHRVKNTLAIIQAIARQSLRHTKSPSEFVSAFTGRVNALARAHDLLTMTKLQSSNLQELVRDQVMLGGEEDDRITCAGPLVLIDPQKTVHLALVLHELATNARKYGALSVPKGRLSVSWEVRTADQRSLFMIWEERNGPITIAPFQRGFGSILIERTLSGHGGEATIEYKSTGLLCQITLPLPELAQSAGTPAGGEDHSTFDPGADSALRLQGTRIIVVEDEPLIALDMESILIAAGCEVAGAAGTLEKAKALVARAEFDAALLDVNLGGDSVGELAAALIQRNVPFAFVTGYGREALPEGFQDMVAVRKPAGQKELLAVVQRLVSRSAPTTVPQPADGPSNRPHASMDRRPDFPTPHMQDAMKTNSKAAAEAAAKPTVDE